jgi:hypothetical protein
MKAQIQIEDQVMRKFEIGLVGVVFALSGASANAWIFTNGHQLNGVDVQGISIQEISIQGSRVGGNTWSTVGQARQTGVRARGIVIVGGRMFVESQPAQGSP